MTLGDVVVRAGASPLDGCGIVIDAWPFSDPVGVTVMWEPLIYGRVSHDEPDSLTLVELLAP